MKHNVEFESGTTQGVVPDSSHSINPTDYPHLTPEEIMAQTAAIEEAKAEKKRQREHRKRIRELKELQLKKSRRVAPFILLFTVVIGLILMLLRQKT